jgi:hypothetical protein
MCKRKYFFLARCVCTDGTCKRKVSTRIFMGPTSKHEAKTKQSYVVQILGIQKGQKSTTSIKMCTGRICQEEECQSTFTRCKHVVHKLNEYIHDILQNVYGSNAEM